MRRDGLRESLEQYAQRHRLPLEYARVWWRAEGLRLLRHDIRQPMNELAGNHVLCRIAPGIAVPTPGYECDFSDDGVPAVLQ